jgi:hypothetical protein
MSFSAILRTTRSLTLDTVVEGAENGALPVPKTLGQSRLKLVRDATGGKRLSQLRGSSENTFFHEWDCGRLAMLVGRGVVRFQTDQFNLVEVTLTQALLWPGWRASTFTQADLRRGSTCTRYPSFEPPGSAPYVAHTRVVVAAIISWLRWIRPMLPSLITTLPHQIPAVWFSS